MKQTSQRTRAAVTHNASERRTRLLEGAIRSVALEIRPETRAIMPAFEHMIGLWNSHAERIDREVAPGLFGLRLVHKGAIEVEMANLYPDVRPAVPIAEQILDDLAATERDGGVYGWMSDFLFMTFYVSEKDIKRQASGRESWWNRVLRKRALTTQIKRALNVREEQDKKEADLVQDRREQIERFRLAVETQIRADPDCKDIATGWPHRNKGGGSATPMPQPHQRRAIGGASKLESDEPTGGVFAASKKGAYPNLFKGYPVAALKKYVLPDAISKSKSYANYLRDMRGRLGSAKSADSNTGNERIPSKKALGLVAVEEDLTSGNDDKIGKKAERMAIDDGLTLNSEKKGRGKLGDPLA
jgi:hypothetical protein